MTATNKSKAKVCTNRSCNRDDLFIYELTSDLFDVKARIVSLTRFESLTIESA